MNDINPSAIKAKEALGALSDELNARFVDGELAVGPDGGEIYISTEDGKTFTLASERPLYEFKKGKPKLVKAGTKPPDVGWSYTAVSADRLRAALDLALSDSPSEPSELEFAYESILRDHCAGNLSSIEPGLTLFEKDGISGVEYPAGGRFIDILAIDSQGALVVIELKLSRGHDRVVGQLAHYLGWVQQNLAQPQQRVRGMIIVRQVTEGLRLASGRLADVSLFQYELSVSLTKA